MGNTIQNPPWIGRDSRALSLEELGNISNPITLFAKVKFMPI
jgi:hypothetical protein